MYNTAPTIDDLIPKDAQPIVFEFFVYFSRFEYALKQSGYLIGNNDVKADWDRYGNTYNNAFSLDRSPELKSACDYLKQNPPRKQHNANNTLSWSAPVVHGNEPLLTWLLAMIRRVRNNLFHGGKYPQLPIPEPSRDTTLLRYSLTILKESLKLDAKVLNHFISST